MAAASSNNMHAFLREVEERLPMQRDLRIDLAGESREVKKRVAEKLKLAGIETIVDAEPGVVVDLPPAKSEPPVVALVVALNQVSDVVIGLTVASVMNRFRDNLREKVRFIFAPALTSPHETAHLLQWQGATIPVFVGFNVGDTVAAGHVAIPMREITLASQDFTLSVSAQHPESDSIQVATQIVAHLNPILTRKTDPLASARMTFSSIQSHARPRRVEVEGSVYMREDGGSGLMASLLEQTIATMCKTYGAAYQLDFKTAVRSLKVDGLMSRHLRESAAEVLGKDRVSILTYPGHEFEALLEYFKQVPGGVLQIGTVDERNSPPASASAIQAGVKALGWTLLKKSL